MGLLFFQNAMGEQLWQASAASAASAASRLAAMSAEQERQRQLAASLASPRG